MASNEMEVAHINTNRLLYCNVMIFRLSYKWTIQLFALRDYGEPHCLPLG